MDWVEYKGSRFSIQKPESTKRILVLGGSAAEGFGGKYENSWAALLKKKIQESLPDRKIELINMAQGANTSIDDYRILLEQGLRLAPDLVIVYAGWNDIAAFSGNPGWMVDNIENFLQENETDTANYSFEIKLRRMFFIIRRYEKLKENFEEAVSEVYATIIRFRNVVYAKVFTDKYFPISEFKKHIRRDSRRSASESLSFKSIMSERETQASYLEYASHYTPEFVDVFDKYYPGNLKLLANTLDVNNITSLFVFQPDLLYKRHLSELSERELQIARGIMGERLSHWKFIVDTFYPLGIEAMREASREVGASFIDMTEVLKDERIEAIYNDNVHYTEEGNLAVANKLFPKVRMLLGEVDYAI